MRDMDYQDLILCPTRLSCCVPEDCKTCGWKANPPTSPRGTAEQQGQEVHKPTDFLRMALEGWMRERDINPLTLLMSGNTEIDELLQVIDHHRRKP